MTPAFDEAAHAALTARLAARLPAAWRTRFAPAPTGFLHLGHAVNAVYVWSVAQAFGGSVVVRIEDHDRSRWRADFDDAIREDLSWLGLEAAAPEAGSQRVFRQSEHAGAYAEALATLEAQRLAYPCTCSRRTIGGGADEGAEVRYPGICRAASIDGRTTQARRVRLPEGTVTFDDIRHGPQAQTPQSQCGDLLARDRLGQWTYQFAVVVDDMRHGIGLVIRGDDLLASTGRQIALGSLLGRAEPPLFLHHPLILRPDGRKLSKSTGDSALRALRSDTWDPARVLGHAAWLGGLQARPDPIEARRLGALWR